MKHFSKYILILVLTATGISCSKDYGNLNGPSVEGYLKNATKDQLNNLVTGTESALRNNLSLYLDDIGVIGREIYRISGSEPRFTTDLLGAADAQLSNNAFYITNTWSSKYRVVKNANILIDAAINSTTITEPQRKAYIGFAKTIKAYQLLLISNLTYQNGIRVNVADPENLGPIETYDNALTAIAGILDEAKTDLAGSEVVFRLSNGFAGLSDAAGLVKFNRAISARVAIYRKQWAQSLTALNESFFNLNGNLNFGVYHVFGTGSGDQLNQSFFPQNQNGENRLAHPSFAADITPGDDRIAKASLRNEPVTNSGLTSDRDVWVYTNATDPLGMIRNEELILIYAEAKIQTNALPDAVTAINIIRDKHNLTPYGGAVTVQALTTEMLRQRRYSLFAEGHRWLDVRRYDLLNTLPIDRPDDNVWSQFPLPLTEN
ncbi:RagB/SusD family nutrient uptake outer membrane protein [Pollutibacter soli]|uniref:RagB/SusD family nutrient uptake outer membrane protein n=1 Tax=Pollutibacter soli TaxID=3034157 RepID=UPI003013C115